MIARNEAEVSSSAEMETKFTELPFPPLTKSHILNCSFHSWYSKYRTITPKARLIPLTQPFLTYLRRDGILLPPDETDRRDWSDSDSGIFSETENPDASDDDEDEDPSTQWQQVHEAIQTNIEELGGKVIPKLNWSAPKDATWMSATNSLECRTPNDIYLLLKSSDFVTHDLEHAFDDCVDDPEEFTASGETQSSIAEASIPYHLILRKYFQLNPSLEFRCFVRNRRLIALCQRDLNHFEFLFKMQDMLRDQIQDFFNLRLRDTFPDENFVFDVYVPPPHDRVWLVDLNPWAVRTDPLLFSWLEILTLPEPPAEKRNLLDGEEVTIRIPLRPAQRTQGDSTSESAIPNTQEKSDTTEAEMLSDDEEADEELFLPEFRLVRRDDPEAYGFTSPQYSAHKLPRDVVDASCGGEGSLREFADRWKEILAKQQRQDAEYSSDED